MSYDLIDLSGYSFATSTRTFERGAREAFELARIPVNSRGSTYAGAQFTFRVNKRANEDASYFGPLGALLLMPLSIAFVAAVSLGRVARILIVPALALPLFMVGVALAVRYGSYNGRYLVPGIVLAMPLAAWVYRWRVLAAALAGVGVATLGLAHVFNEAKPTGHDGRTPIWSMDRIAAQSVMRTEMAEVIRAIEREVPRDGGLGYVLHNDDWVYPLYGPRLSRTLVRLPRARASALAGHADVDAVVLSRLVSGPLEGWRVIRLEDARWTLLVRNRA